MPQYLIIIEKAESNYGAYCPYVSGCIGIGNTNEETVQNLNEGLQFPLKDENNLLFCKGLTAYLNDPEFDKIPADFITHVEIEKVCMQVNQIGLLN